MVGAFQQLSALRVRNGSVTPESAGWTYVGFSVLPPGRAAGTSRGRARAVRRAPVGVVLVHGARRGIPRDAVFDGPPTALYVPPGTPWWVEGEGELAVCTAPARGDLEVRLLDTPELITRGSGNEERFVANILMESEPAESLLVTEVVTPAGHWSSFPPHKHDRDDPPNERALEETYYHRAARPARASRSSVCTRTTATSTRRSPLQTATSSSCRAATTRSPPILASTSTT